MKLIVSVLKPTNKANGRVPLERGAAVRANYARIAAKRRERNDGWMAARRALCTLPRGADGAAAFVPRGYRVVWPYKGVMPDADNIVARCKNVLDGICLALNVNDRTLDLLGVQRVHVRKGERPDMDEKLVYLEFEGEVEERRLT